MGTSEDRVTKTLKPWSDAFYFLMLCSVFIGGISYFASATGISGPNAGELYDGLSFSHVPDAKLNAGQLISEQRAIAYVVNLATLHGYTGKSCYGLGGDAAWGTVLAHWDNNGMSFFERHRSGSSAALEALSASLLTCGTLK